MQPFCSLQIVLLSQGQNLIAPGDCIFPYAWHFGCIMTFISSSLVSWWRYSGSRVAWFCLSVQDTAPSNKQAIGVSTWTNQWKAILWLISTTAKMSQVSNMWVKHQYRTPSAQRKIPERKRGQGNPANIVMFYDHCLNIPPRCPVMVQK